MRRFGLIALASLLSACSTTASLETLRTARLTGSEFHIELARHYLDLAEKEVAVYDWWSSKYFADKGMMAAYGQEVPPERLDNWNISDPKAREELQAAHMSLTAALTPDLKQRDPKRAAQLQFAFDCWMEEQEEGWEQEAIDNCRNRFYRELDKPADTAEATQPKELIAKPEAKTAQQKPEPIVTSLSSSYLIHFPWDEGSVSGMARDELEAIAVALKNSPKTRVVINGHADRSGDDNYNLQLSQKRADFIRDFFKYKGVAPGRIDYFAFGESDPVVPTDDGQREAANRRVEIFIE